MARILILDIETTPSLGYVYSLWRQNVGVNQIERVGEMVCMAWKWYGEKKVYFTSEWTDGRQGMLDTIWELLDEADVVVHYNGKRFDMPTINREFWHADMLPPSPYQQVDLYQVAKSKFRFLSNKLDFVAADGNLGHKMDTGGFELWLGVIRRQAAAQDKMRKYNRRDVTLTEALYVKMLPWITNHPHVGLIDGDPGACDRCGGHSFQSRGYAYTRLGMYHRYRCNDCGGWTRIGRSTERAVQRAIA
jgi:DNA polymerase elongation subunit (family B)